MEPNFIKTILNSIKGRSIFLIGMMGSGKSKTGPELAKKLNYKFVDLDTLIENLAKKSIDKIFKEDGENYFSELETKCLKEIIQIPSMIVSTGTIWLSRLSSSSIAFKFDKSLIYFNL